MTEGIENNECARCLETCETWEHLWTCKENGDNLENILKEAIEEVVNETEVEERDRIVSIGEKIRECSKKESKVLENKEQIDEFIRGIISRSIIALGIDQKEKIK